MAYTGKKPIDHTDVTQSQSMTVTDDLTVDTSTLHVDSANNRVGIGTSSPYRKLVVSGDQTTEGLLEIGASTPQLLFSVPSGGLDSRIHNDGSGNFIFGTGTNSATPTERMRILSGGGITFNGDTATANALDDYEEGTFTPALSTGTATFELANYIKVGALVTVSFVMSNFSNRTSTADVRVTGLPYSSISGGSFVSACLARYINSGGDSVVAYQAANDDKLYFYTVNQGSNYGSVDHDNLNSSNASFYVTHTYRAS